MTQWLSLSGSVGRATGLMQQKQEMGPEKFASLHIFHDNMVSSFNPTGFPVHLHDWHRHGHGGPAPGDVLWHDLEGRRVRVDVGGGGFQETVYASYEQNGIRVRSK